MLNRSIGLKLGTGAILLSALSFSIWVACLVLSATPENRIQFVPDDAFYYLTLARNFATQGRWTFDSGISLTSGFHPLYAYFLAALYRTLRPAAEQFVLLSVLFSYLLILPSYAMSAVFAYRARNLVPALLLLVFMLSRNVSLNSIAGVEWTSAILFSSLYCTLFALLSGSESRAANGLLFGCALLGTLARSDCGLLHAGVVVGALANWLATRERRPLVRAAAGFGGAVLGVFVVSAHGYLISGEVLQSSARMKALWLHVYGPSFGPIVRTMLALFGSRSNSVAAVATAALGCLALALGAHRFLTIFSRRRPSRPHPSPSLGNNVNSGIRILWLGCVIAIAGYVLLYSLNPAALQNWYSANLVVPLFLAVALPLANGEPSRPAVIVATVLLATLGITQARRAISFSRTPEWPHQVFMYRAGNELRTPRFARGVGSWNAGIIGYYQGGTVVNIDGLVNNDIYPYAVRNALPEYIDAKAIVELVDFEVMLSGADYRKRGGYDRPDFLARLEPERVFGGTPPGQNQLTLYRVLPRPKP